jgi:hypothetical protein
MESTPTPSSCRPHASTGGVAAAASISLKSKNNTHTSREQKLQIIKLHNIRR